MGTTRLTAVIAAITIAVTAALCSAAISPDPVWAYGRSQERAIQFISVNTDSVVRAADLAASAARADGNGSWVRASELVLASSRILTRVCNRWVRMPVAGGATLRLERQFGAFLKNVNLYGLCVSRSIAGDASWSNIHRGNRAWNRAVANLANITFELAYLD